MMIDSTLLLGVLRIAFSLLIACIFTSVVCGAVLFFFKTARINEVLKHPYLKQRSFKQYPLSVRATIALDYFLRLAFPGRKFWVAGQANQLLAHVQPKEVPLDVKWPVIGFWGACLLGLPTLIVLWVVVMIAR
jgi:hypothetical protein